MVEQIHGAHQGLVRSVAVIGAGSRGRAFARRCVTAGYKVVLEDVLSSKLRKAEEEFAGAPQDWQGRILLVSSVEDAVRDVDLAVDFVPDELESKLEIFSMMDRMAPPRTIFCTPTLLSISDLAACTYRRGLCFALAPFDEHGIVTWRLTSTAWAESGVTQGLTAFFETLGSPVELGEEAPTA